MSYARQHLLDMRNRCFRQDAVALGRQTQEKLTNFR
jgi:hypothetical protein